jgi:hypothetical protein
MKKTLIQIAREEGWNMVACEGEADVHIGGLDLDETNVVISSDSDLLFYPRVQQVLRPMKDCSFHLYRKSNVTAVSNVTALQWTCVGIVSGNDYNRNIKGFGKLQAMATPNSIAGYSQDQCEPSYAFVAGNSQ